MKISYDEIVTFHGHSCPGLAIGYAVTLAGLTALNVERPKDEELVVIVENDACGTDAVQYTAGCTFGKGNLIFRDYGKHVYTFADRKTKRSVRITLKKEFREYTKDFSREDKIKYILNTNPEVLCNIEEVKIKIPEKAKIFDSAFCAECGETVAVPKAVTIDDKIYCKPCIKEDEL